MLGLVLSVFLLGLSLVYLYFHKLMKKKYRFWQDREVECKEPSLLFGNVADLVLRRKSFFEITCALYHQFPDKRYNGFYQLFKPILLIRDPELIKKVTIKDFEYFVDHVPFGGGEGDKIVTKAIFNLTGQDWKEMRCTLSPAFTSSKMRNMFIFMCDCVERFTDHMEKKDDPIIIDEFRSLFSRFTNDVIASTAFGVNCDSLGQPKNEFYRMGSMAVKYLQGFKVLLSQVAPALYQVLKLGLFPEEMTSFFKTLVRDNMDQREKKNIFRPDMIHLLMEAKKGRLKYETSTDEIMNDGFATAQESQVGRSDCQKKDLSYDDMVGQVMLFFFAGFDSVSLVSGFMAYELALNPDIQKTLQNEVQETRKLCNGKITYEKLLAMKYMDQVVSETLRKWPIGFRLDRLCTKDYTIPPETKDEKPLTIKKGEVINIPVAGIHRDPKYFPDPMKFDPDRFSDERKSTIIPETYIPFGIGPRNCIGSRFALLEVKVLFFHLLEKFDIVPVRQTQIPLRFCRKQFNPCPEKGFWLGLKSKSRQ